MRLCKVKREDGSAQVGLLEDNNVRLLGLADDAAAVSLSDLLHTADPRSAGERLLHPQSAVVPLDKVRLLAPLARQEVWPSGGPSKPSRYARHHERGASA